MKKRLRETLSEVLPQEDLVSIHNSYDIVGDIAVIRTAEAPRKHAKLVAEAILNIHRNVSTVLTQTSPVKGDLRLRKLDHVAGTNKTSTKHKESNCQFSVDIARCYFSPRLSNERMRIAEQVRSGEVVVNMFAGVGCFSIVAARYSHARTIYSIDINPVAVEFMRENVRLNEVYGKVIPILGDAKQVIAESLCGKADRVLMPLPEKAFEYLPYALQALKSAGGWIHYYDFEYANRNENPVDKVKLKVAERLEHLCADFCFRFGHVLRTTGPNWHQVVLDIRIEHASNRN